MRAITYSNARKNLRALIQDVCKNAKPTIIVGSQDEEQAVLLSLDNFSGHGKNCLSVRLTELQLVVFLVHVQAKCA